MGCIEIKKILRHFPKLFLNLIYFIASLVPRNRTLWLFSCWGGTDFLDNPKYIFNELKTRDSLGVKAFWLVKKRKKFFELSNRGVDVIYAYSLKGVWSQLRAGVVVFTHSVNNEYLSYLIAHRVKRVQTWHGIPIKKIGYDDENSTPKEIIAIWNRVFPYISDHLDLVLAASEEDSRIYASAFNIEIDKVVITGYPRNDGLLKRCKKNNKLEVIYMPTYRGAVNSEFKLFQKTNLDFVSFDRTCGELGINFSIKLHPVQRFNSIDLGSLIECTNIKILKDVGDVYERLHEFDVLVTDFSGVYFDFFITGKPIIMAPFNINEYLSQDRSLYYSYEDICPGPPVHSWDELLCVLNDLKFGKIKKNDRYFQLQSRFHQNLDSLSSSRAIDAIRSIL